METHGPATEVATQNITDLCSYDLPDYEVVKPRIESLFLQRPTASRAFELFNSFSGLEGLGTFELPMIREGRLVREGDRHLLSGEKLTSGKVVCEKPFGNTDIWWFALHEGKAGEILNFDFYVLVDDENFAKRGVPIKPQYFHRNQTFRKAVLSIIREEAPTIDQLQKQLVSAGFSVRISEEKFRQRRAYLFSGENRRHWNRVLPLIGGSNGFYNTSVYVDKDGNYLM